ncbi:MAG: HAD hydrolase family protein [Clostridia bacterium]|nr:HAD hydrolase family protein [Clostridia bacterium]
MGKFDNYILASDIDGTFVGRNGTIHPYNIEKVRYFNQNGGKFLFSSGRNSKDIHTVVAGTEELINEACVLCNGAILYDIHTDEIENPVFLDNSKLIPMLIDIGEVFPDVGIRTSCDVGFIIRDTDEYIANDLKRGGLMKYATAVGIDEFYNYRHFKTVITGDPARISVVGAYVREKYRGVFDFTMSSEKILEVLKPGISKAYQLKYLRDKHAKTNPQIELWCVGDFDNDIDMLKFADVAACPENATDTVKSLCDIHLCKCVDGAVGQLIDIIEAKQNRK